ncbi:hypothetical protein CDL60_12375 [Roseateles noduli]|nr:hypothetical protein CDL60_12375 [Roseateles noduli]
MMQGDALCGEAHRDDLQTNPDESERLARTLPLADNGRAGCEMPRVCPGGRQVRREVSDSRSELESSGALAPEPEWVKTFKLKHGCSYEAHHRRLLALATLHLQALMPQGMRLEILEWHGAFAAKLHQDAQISPSGSMRSSGCDTGTSESDSDDDSELFNWTGFGVDAFFSAIRHAVGEIPATDQAWYAELGKTVDQVQRGVQQKAGCSDSDWPEGPAGLAPTLPIAFNEVSWADDRVPWRKPYGLR